MVGVKNGEQMWIQVRRLVYKSISFSFSKCFSVSFLVTGSAEYTEGEIGTKMLGKKRF